MLFRAPSHILTAMDELPSALSYFLIFEQPGVEVLLSAPSYFLIFGQPGVRMCCSELPVTFWTARSEDVRPSAPNYFLDSQE